MSFDYLVEHERRLPTSSTVVHARDVNNVLGQPASFEQVDDSRLESPSDFIQRFYNLLFEAK